MTPGNLMPPPSQILGINYHYCAPIGRALPGFNGVTPELLDKQLASVSAACRSFPLEALPLSLSPDAGGTGCLISFDDGMRDVVEHALPVVNRYGFPVMLFCCAMPYEEGRVLNVQKSHLLQGRWGWPGFRTRFMTVLADDPEGGGREDSSALGLDRMYRYDDAETGAFKRLLNVELPYSVVDRVLDRLFEAEFGSQREAVEHLYMSLDDIRRCSDKGVSIGLHTYSHCMLSRLSPAGQAEEMDASLSLFRDRLGLNIDALSYPYGIKGSWNVDTKVLASERGLRTGYTLGRVKYRPETHPDPMEIPRFDVNDVFGPDGALKLAL